MESLILSNIVMNWGHEKTINETWSFSSTQTAGVDNNATYLSQTHNVLSHTRERERERERRKGREREGETYSQRLGSSTSVMPFLTPHLSLTWKINTKLSKRRKLVLHSCYLIGDCLQYTWTNLTSKFCQTYYQEVVIILCSTMSLWQVLNFHK